jgi:hypothetical protein
MRFGTEKAKPTPIVQAIANGDTHTALQAINQDRYDLSQSAELIAGVPFTDYRPVEIATERNNLRVLEQLITKGAEVKREDLDVAFQERFLEAFRKLVRGNSTNKPVARIQDEVFKHHPDQMQANKVPNAFSDLTVSFKNKQT